MVTPFILHTGADVAKIVLEFSARTLPAWEVTVSETDYGQWCLGSA